MGSPRARGTVGANTCGLSLTHTQTSRGFIMPHIAACQAEWHNEMRSLPSAQSTAACAVRCNLAMVSGVEYVMGPSVHSIDFCHINKSNRCGF